MSKSKIFILDAYALIFRSYYAFINNPRYNSKGLNTSAIFGFLNTLDEILKKENPSHIVICFDPPAPSFRKDIYPEYKANRSATPEDIKKSVPYIKEILDGFNIKYIEIPNYEADDVAGTIAKKFSNPDNQIFLMTSDKDYLQLIDENISVYKPRTKNNEVIIIDIEEFKKEFGLNNPLQFIDILAIAGDTADNVPGIPGFGEKTAMDFIQKYHSIENIYRNIDKLTPRQQQKLNEHKEILFLSRTLVTIKTDIEINLDLEQIARKEPNNEKLNKLFEELEFRKTAQRVLEKKSEAVQQSLFGDLPVVKQTDVSSTLLTIKDIKPDYRLIETEYELEELINNLQTVKEFSFDTETDSLDAQTANITGFSFCFQKNSAYYIPAPQKYDEAKTLLEKFLYLFNNPDKLIIGQNIKYDLTVLLNYGIKVTSPIFDTMIAHSLLSPELRHNMDYLAETYLNYKTIHIDELIGKKGSYQIKMSELKPEQIKDYAAEDADITFQLKQIFAPKLVAENMQNIFENIEMPLVNVLTIVEHTGVIVDTEFLKDYRKELAEKAIKIKTNIFELAQINFNLDSPKQLGEILFQKLKIADKPKLTKTKQFATDETELSKYTDKHPIVSQILEYRTLNKLITTYIDSLPKLVNPKTKRIHTSYNQTITITGRLSSNNPNLQNIPIKSTEGIKIREAFIPAKGFTFIDADYSQVELRLMAHLSQDPNMLKAFQNNIDIHAQTAAKIFKVDLEDVTKVMRYQAKTANFAMIYGSSSFGLSQNLKIPLSEAKKLLDNYFATYTKVKEYMDKIIQFARDNEYVTTLFGRKRYLNDINSRNSLLRSNSEHNAINTPIQGSAADIIKLAMKNIQNIIEKQNLEMRMILQVHDELLFEVPFNEIEIAEKIIKHEMEHAVELSVPLIVEIGKGNNWAVAH